MKDKRVYWVWLAEALGQGSTLAVKLISAYGSPEDIFNGAADNIETGGAFDEKDVTAVKNKLRSPTLSRANEILETCCKKNIEIVTPDSKIYPSSLTLLKDMPLVLYVKGKLPPNKNLYTTVVGTRKMTDYGRRMAYTIGIGLAFGGSVLVSGMALGSDSMAIIGALDGGGRVVAVLGSGVDNIYPREHAELYHKIIKRGAVISEYPPMTPPLGSHFPVRNRIMSGLSSATVVIEGSETSGSLITARHAAEQGKMVFAVPGKVGDEGSEGPNLLIRDGALPAVEAADVLDEFEFIHKTVDSVKSREKMKKLDLERMSRDAMTRAQIGSSTGNKNGYGRGFFGGRITPKIRKEIDEDWINENLQPKASEEAETKKLPKSEKNENKKASSSKQTVKTSQKVIPARKIDIDMLDENEIKVYNRMKPNVPLQPDSLTDDNFSISDVLAALTVLEMAGAVDIGGGGYYMRVSEDDIMLSQND